MTKLQINSPPDENNILLMPKYIHISLHMLQLRNSRQIKDEYFSILHKNTFHLSTAYDSSMLNGNFIIVLNDNFILPLESGEEVPQEILLQVWENHMIMFEHEVDISELRSRVVTKKKFETRQGEILSFTLRVLEENEIAFFSKYLTSIAQHYLIINKIQSHGDTAKGEQTGPSYFQINTSSSKHIIPVLNSNLIVQLPEIFEFVHVKNGKASAKSRKYKTAEIQSQKMMIQLYKNGQIQADLQLSLKWASNLYKNKNENNLLLDAHEILIYDIQIKFDNKFQFSNQKIKIIYGNKAFELNGEFDQNKTIRFGRIIYFIIKSEEEEIAFVIEKNHKIIAQATISTDEIISYHLNSIKKKISETLTGKQIGVFKFKCEKAKNLSVPQNNSFWKTCNKKKSTQSAMIELSQISVKTQKDQKYSALIKTQKQELKVADLLNFSFYRLQTQIPQPIVLSLKSQQNIYIKIITEEQSKSQFQNEADYIGIAVVNYQDLRLGTNCLTIPFYKNQELTAQLNILINKVMPWLFIKSIFQPEIYTTSNAKSMGVSVMIKKIEFTPYFYTYEYDSKSEVYCIVEINRIKKVLILQRFQTKTDAIYFVNSSGSDILNFVIDESDLIKIKYTLLVSDSGHEEEIYGFANIKVKTNQLLEHLSLDFNNVLLINQFGTQVGSMELEVHKGSTGDLKKGPFKSDIKNVKKDLMKINQSIENVEKSMERNNNINKHKSLKKYDLNKSSVMEEDKKRDGELKLPEIKNKNDRLKNLVQMLQIKKKGRYNENQDKKIIDQRRQIRQSQSIIFDQIPAQDQKKLQIGNNRSLALRKKKKTEDPISKSKIIQGKNQSNIKTQESPLRLPQIRQPQSEININTDYKMQMQQELEENEFANISSPNSKNQFENIEQQIENV